MMGNNLMYGYHLGMGWMLFGMILWIFIVVCAVLVVLWLLRKSGKAMQSHKIDTALEILKKRYVQGEITREQYEEMKKDISE